MLSAFHKKENQEKEGDGAVGSDKSSWGGCEEC